jgi:hypothetical protein
MKISGVKEGGEPQSGVICFSFTIMIRTYFAVGVSRRAAGSRPFVRSN